jgi:DNA ligase-1
MREFVMLAKVYENQDVRGWYMSEKMDGMRAWWDGGITRGRDTREIPWANNQKSSGISTGLWSRYGKVIHAPFEWVDQLPKIPLDGELWLGRGNFQETMSVCRQKVGDARWKSVKYKVFDLPSYDVVFMTGDIRNPNISIKLDTCLDFIGRDKIKAPLPFYLVVDMFGSVTWPDNCEPVTQYKISDVSDLTDYLEVVVKLGGEGLMIRHPGSYWVPSRSQFLLKYKPYIDDMGLVVGWEPGKGKYEGMVGSLVIEWCGRRFQLSGFSDQERKIGHFKIGERVEFRYRELSDGGLPKEARYQRRET